MTLGPQSENGGTTCRWKMSGRGGARQDGTSVEGTASSPGQRSNERVAHRQAKNNKKPAARKSLSAKPALKRLGRRGKNQFVFSKVVGRDREKVEKKNRLKTQKGRCGAAVEALGDAARTHTNPHGHGKGGQQGVDRIKNPGKKVCRIL